MDCTSEHIQVIGSLARQGMTLEQIADVMNVSLSALNSWRKKNPALERVLRQSKLVADALVEDSLYRRAIGFEYEEVVDTELTDGSVKVKRHHKYMPADITACIYWLKNRQPDRWRERKEDDGAKVVEVIMNPTVEGYSE